jgi:hypothetical protein
MALSSASHQGESRAAKARKSKIPDHSVPRPDD